MDTTVPQEMVFALPNPLPLNKVILRPQPTDPEATWVREFEVLVSTEGPEQGFTSVGRWTLDPVQARAGTDLERPDPARFEFPETRPTGSCSASCPTTAARTTSPWPSSRSTGSGAEARLGGWLPGGGPRGGGNLSCWPPGAPAHREQGQRRDGEPVPSNVGAPAAPGE